MDNNEPEFYTIDDIANLLKISRSKASQIIHTQAFPKIKIGRMYRIPIKEFNKWVSKYSYSTYKT